VQYVLYFIYIYMIFYPAWYIVNASDKLPPEIQAKIVQLGYNKTYIERYQPGGWENDSIVNPLFP